MTEIRPCIYIYILIPYQMSSVFSRTGHYWLLYDDKHRPRIADLFHVSERQEQDVREVSQSISTSGQRKQLL